MGLFALEAKMSRSYKKTPYWGQPKDSTYKRLSNKKIRRFRDTLANGSAFKRIQCSYDICDTCWIDYGADRLNPVWRK